MKRLVLALVLLWPVMEGQTLFAPAPVVVVMRVPRALLRERGIADITDAEIAAKSAAMTT